MRDKAPPGEGERREAAQRRKRWVVMAGIGAIGVATGYSAGHFSNKPEALPTAWAWSPGVALALAGIYVIGSVGGSFLMNRMLDEVDRQRGHKAMSFAGTVLIVAYPPWYFLWRGGLVVEPIHLVVFALFWLSLALATLWYRFR